MAGHQKNWLNGPQTHRFPIHQALPSTLQDSKKLSNYLSNLYTNSRSRYLAYNFLINCEDYFETDFNDIYNELINICRKSLLDNYGYKKNYPSKEKIR